MELLHDVIICFVLFSVCGWVCESVFCSVLERKPVNRGFLNGPFCPVYGFGGLIVVYLLGPLRFNYFLLFFCGMVACTVLEYVTSYLLEKLFHAKWWDYSHTRFNINGRVCLSFSLVFGLLSVVAVELIYPPCVRLLAAIPDRAKAWLSAGLVLILLADCAVTVYSLIQLNGKLAEIKAAMDELRQKLEIAQGERVPLAQRIEQYLEESNGRYEEVRQSIQSSLSRFERLTQKHKFQHRRIMRAFPNMKSLKYQEQFTKMRESLSGFGKKKKKN